MMRTAKTLINLHGCIETVCNLENTLIYVHIDTGESLIHTQIITILSFIVCYDIQIPTTWTAIL